MSRWISIAAAVIIVIAIAVLLIIGPKTGSVENLRDTLLGYGPWAIAISAGLMVAQAIVAPLPANVITITNGLIFGPFWGGILSWITTLVGSSLCFLLAKSLGKPFAQKIVGGSLQNAEGFFKRYGLHAMFLVRIVPFVPFDAVSYGAGLVGIPFSRFLLATAIGIIPSVIVYSYLGIIIAGMYWWVLIGLLSVSLIAIILAARAMRRAPQPSPALSKTAA
jgi:uncharacterized membrane protein YdjX (TVP38/TMEM64 family)